MVERLRASHIRLLSAGFLVGMLFVTLVLYYLLGCQNDWMVISGLFVDAIGAVMIAAPELGFLQPYTYSGSVREALDELSGTGDMWIPTEPEWYDVFLEEMKEVLGTEEIPETAEFRIERSRNSNLLWYMPNPGQEDDKAINLFNVFTPFRETIEEEQKQIRKYGATVFVVGIFFQIGGLLYDTILFPTVFC